MKVGDELILVDDNSDEQNTYIISEIIEMYPHIKLYKNKRRKGSSFAKDFGIKKASNEIIVILDGDDLLPENTLFVVREAFSRDNNISFVYGNYIKREFNTGKEIQINCSSISDEHGFLNPKLLAKKWIILGSSPFKKSAYLEVGGFDYLYPKTDDLDFQRRLITAGAIGKYIDQTIYVWNKSAVGNNANVNIVDRSLSWFRNIEFYYKYLSKIDFCFVVMRRLLRLLVLSLTK